jgi:gliding motility-associated-like protein
MPLSNCDMTRPNGIATAAVEGGIPTDYIFDWYEGLDTSDPLKLKAANSVQVDGLAATVYTVHAIDRVTGCDGTASIAIPDGTAPLPPSEIQVVKLQDVSTCQPLVNPDGALSASVNGDVVNYDFYWYNSNPGANPDINGADFTGREFYDSLAAGTYYVSVVNRTTGCPGGPANAVIEAHPVFPDFDFLTETATCKKNDTEPGDGYISLVMNNSVDIGKVEWFEKGGSASLVDGPNLENAEAGTYTVRVTTIQGCSTDKDVLLKTDIRPFNGISRNHDGQNETFFIKCLEEFPDNIVKIFNRAGTLVYEAEHYDNLDIYFDGISNKGISLMGNNLPDGTYFYVIDKRDGSKPVAGYLEIVN